MIEKLEGIVVRENNYGESSKIINVITKEKGYISIMCKGARKVKSKIGASTSKISYGFFNVYYKENKLSTLISVDIIDNFSVIKKDIEKISYANYILELIGQVYKNDVDQDIYNLMITTLLKINENLDPMILTNILELKLLEYIGLKPELDRCVMCGTKDNIVSLSADKGGFICAKCHSDEPYTDRLTIKMIRMFYYVDLEKVSKTDMNEKTKREIDRFISYYYDQYSGLYLKSKQFLKDIKELN